MKSYPRDQPMWSQPLPEKVFFESRFQGYWCDTTPALHIQKTMKPYEVPLPKTISDGPIPSPRSMAMIMSRLCVSRYRDYLCNTSQLLQLLIVEMPRYEIKRSMTLIDPDPIDTIPPGLVSVERLSALSFSLIYWIQWLIGILVFLSPRNSTIC